MTPFPLPEDLRAAGSVDFVVERIVAADAPELWRLGFWLGVGLGAGFGVVGATAWLVACALTWGLS